MEHQETIHQKEAHPKGWVSTHQDWFFLAALILWAYAFVLLLPIEFMGISLTLFALTGIAIAYLYLRLAGKTPSKGSYLYLGALVMLAVSFALMENNVKPLLFLALPCFLGCWLLHAAQSRPLDGSEIQDGIALFVLRPFQNLGEKGKSFAIQKNSKSQLKYIAMGILVTLPVLAIAAALLMEADKTFANLLGNLGGTVFDQFGATMLRLVVACGMALYLLSLLMSAAHPKEKSAIKPFPQMNGTVVAILAGALCALYAAFVMVQILSVSGVYQAGQRSAAFYSEYARDGFFELCLVSLLNLAVFVGAQLFHTEKTKAMRVLLSALGVLTQALIITAIAKMGMYMTHYGLTLLRVQTIWFMATLFLVFGVLIALQWKKFEGFKSIVVLVAVSVLAASYANIGGLVAKGNVDRYLAGAPSHFDVDQYREFPFAAAPHLIQLRQETADGAARANVDDFLMELTQQPKPAWYDQSVQQLMARQEIEAFWKEAGQGPWIPAE